MALEAGDLLFVGWDSDNNDIAFITTVSLVEGEVIYFTDDEWDGTDFNGGEQYMEWTVPVGGLPSGTVVNIDMDNAGNTATISHGSLDYMRGGGALAGGNEMFWAFQGTRTGDTATPDTFISVIGNEADGNYNRSPELSGTGLTTANGALIIDGDEDYMEWTADGLLPDPAVKDDLQASILNGSNWTTDDGGGNNNPHGTGFDVSTPTVVCFMRGTLIETPLGARPVEALSKGDLVLTRDNAAQVLKMLCSTRVVPAATIFGQHLSPVCVTQGSLGLGLPKRDLWVSQQHRILVRSAIANRMFGAPEVLIAAVKLEL
jgi:hypothetical protein